MLDRRRVAATIVRNGHILMVRERNRGPDGRHDGLEYWTLPGGGVEPGESAEQALRREVREEVGLVVVAVSPHPLFEFPYPSGHTVVYGVEVAPGDPVLGVDEDRDCECPRLVGVDWLPVPPLRGETGGLAVPTLIVATGAASGLPVGT
jgi:8-oxo-dGTP diphosphatase